MDVFEMLNFVSRYQLWVQTDPTHPRCWDMVGFFPTEKAAREEKDAAFSAAQSEIVKVLTPRSERKEGWDAFAELERLKAEAGVSRGS